MEIEPAPALPEVSSRLQRKGSGRASYGIMRGPYHRGVRFGIAPSLLVIVAAAVLAASCHQGNEAVSARFMADQEDLWRRCGDGFRPPITSANDRALASDVSSMVAFAEAHPNATELDEGDSPEPMKDVLEATAWSLTCNRPLLVSRLISTAQHTTGRGDRWVEEMPPDQIAALTYAAHDMNARCYERSDGNEPLPPLEPSTRAAFEQDANTIVKIARSHPAAWDRLGVRVEHHAGMPQPLQVTFLDPVGATCGIADILLTIERAAGVPAGTLSQGP